MALPWLSGDSALSTLGLASLGMNEEGESTISDTLTLPVESISD